MSKRFNDDVRLRRAAAVIIVVAIGVSNVLDMVSKIIVLIVVVKEIKVFFC